MKKYLFSIICTLLPIFASAQEPYAIFIDNGTALEFRYDNEKAARGGMDIGPFTSMDQVPWHENSQNIYSVIFDPSFANCTSITSTSLWFAFLSNLDYIGGIEYLNTSNVTDMYGMFWESWTITSLDLSSFNTGSVTDMGSMFAGCTALTTIYVSSGWSTSSVTSSNAMFEGCTSLMGESGTTYDSSHTDAEYARIDMASSPGYLTYKNGGSSGQDAQYWMELESTLQYADDVYGRARNNSNVDPWMLEELSEFMNRGSDMLDERTAEEEEVRHMIEEISWICWEIEEAMNREPEPSGEAEPYAVLSDNNTVLTFYYDDQKAARNGLDVGPFNLASERGWDDVRESITTVIFDSSFENCPSITSTAFWFYQCNHLESIVGLEYLNTSFVTNMTMMFYKCSNITSIDVSNFNTSNVTNMSCLFWGCSSLTNIDVSNFNTANVTDMGSMFEDCSSLTSIDVSKFNTSYVTNMSVMFGSCFGLTTIDVRNFNTSNVTNLYAMFWECSGLTSIDVSNFNTANVTNMAGMFLKCSNLKTIYASDRWSTTSVIEGYDIFMGCENLVGGRGTTYDPDHIDVEYAHIDGGPDNPGYLTEKNAEPGEGEARFDGLTAWVYGDKTLDDAFAEVGREEALKTIAAIVWEGDGALTAEQMQGITNPNLLVYVNEASKAPAGVQNIIVNGSAAQIVLTDASGNNNFHCPQSFTAQSISYTRNFSQTTEIGVCRGWETIALPFNVQSISHSHGALVPFGGGNGGYPFWLHQLQDNSLSPVTVMEANTPYLICMPNNKVYPSAYNQAGSVTFASSNVTVPETHPHEGYAGNVMLIPAFQSVEASPDIYTLNVGEASGSYAEGSVFISNYRSVRPFQAYTVHTNGARGEDIRYIPLTTLGGGTDGTTGIMEILQPVGNDAGAWYSLDGRKLDAKPTRKGVYIQNGKKIVIK